VTADCRVLISLVYLALAACDNTPNAGFQQAIKKRQEATTGDKYASLENTMPRVSNYSNRKPQQRRDYAVSQAGNFRATYDSLLTQLDADKAVDHTAMPFKRCRPAFVLASRARSGKGSMEDGVAALRDCRSAAQSAQKEGGAAGEAAGLLSRFASAGIALIGVELVGEGKAGPGLKIWGDGEALAQQDKPGFKLSVESFRGY